ncbi:P-loop containing nucleoside triphosphate hydrolase protein, partial [Geranomyces variabilis]
STMARDLLKVVLLGDGSVGKTSLRNQFIHKRFADAYKATIGADFVSKDVETQDGRRVSMQIWDTAGQERFQSLGVAFYRGTDACILVYDVTQPDSTKNLVRWLSEFIRQADIQDPETFPFVLVGNKIDVVGRAVTKQHGQDLAQSSTGPSRDASLPLFEVSAKAGTRVDEIFAYIARNVRSPKYNFDITADETWDMDDPRGRWRPVKLGATKRSERSSCAC